MILLRTYISLAFLFIFCLLSAQDYIAGVQHFGLESGISNKNVFCSYRDTDGYIWLGTQYGVNRFDGYEFKSFTKERDGLASNKINQIFQDKDGWLWLLYNQNPVRFNDVLHLSLLNPQTGEVRTLEGHFGSELPFKREDLHRVTIDEKNKTVLLGTYDGRLFIYEKGKTFRTISQKRWDEVYPWLLTDSKNILIESGDNFEINELSDDGKVLSTWDGSNFFALGGDTSGTILGYFRIQTAGGGYDLKLVSFDPGDSPKPIKIIDKLSGLKLDGWNAKVYYRKTDDTYWYKSEERFFVFHPEKGILFDFNTKYPEISKNIIQDIHFDKTGIVQVSTYRGFYILRLGLNPFKRILHNPSDVYDVNKFVSCRGMARTGDSLWLGTELQKNRLIDLKTFKSETIPNFQIADIYGKPYALEGKVIIPGEKDNLIFAEIGLLNYGMSDGSEQYIPWETEPSCDIWSIYRDQNETVWLGTYSGPIGFWKEGMDSVRIFRKMNGFEFPPGGYIYTFLQLDSDNLLVGTSFGIYLLNPEKGILKRFWTGGTKDSYFPNDLVFHLAKDKKEEGVIWVATGGGLIRWTGDGGRWTAEQSNQASNYRQFTVTDGLSANMIYAVYEDEFENLWLPSEYGIIRFDKKTEFSKAYLQKDGIAFDEFNPISHYEDDVGNLYFGGLNGVTTFHPNDFVNQSDTLDVPLRITKFQKFDSEADKVVDETFEFLSDPNIVLKPGDNFFSLKFSLLEFQDASRLRYGYKIASQGNDWNFISNNSLRISGLDYGYDTLRIKGQGSNGQFSKQEISILIRILKPVYLRTWFLVSSILGFFIFGFSFYRYRIGQLTKQKKTLEKTVRDRTNVIEKQSKALKEMDQLKSRFFANVSHELRTPLTLMLGPTGSLLKRGYLTDKDRELLEYVYKNEKHLLGLVNEILDLSKLETNRLTIKETAVNFHKYLEPLVAQFISFGDSAKVNFTFIEKPGKDLRILLDIGKFEKIINNFLSNAMKFTPANGAVKLTVRDLEERILVTVKDTGTGIHPDDLPHIFERFFQSKQSDAPVQGGTGIGLSLCKELAELLGGRVWAESEFGTGSTFYFEFPKKEAPPQLLTEEAVDSESAEPTELVFDGLKKSEVESAAVEIQAEEFDERPKLLVVEDNFELRNYLRLTLEEDYRILTAENGKVALDVLAEEKVDLIISDLMMPIMDGFQLLERLKSKDQWRHIPVIMLTARADIKVKLRALRIGVDDYMIKPFVEEELQIRIANLLQNYRERIAFADLLNESESATGEDTVFISEEDSRWLGELEAIAIKHLHNHRLNSDFFASQLLVSRNTFFRKIKQLTGLTPNDYFNEVRFNKARELMENRTLSSVKAVAGEVGMKDVKYFSKQYKSKFGKSPSAYF